MYSQIKQKVYLLLDPADGSTKWDKIINAFIVGLIILNTIAVIVETVDSVYLVNKALFRNLEFISVAVFSIEYILRLWSCTAMKKYQHPVTGRFKYVLSIGSIIDLI
jgi:voltage-gated potassium channel